MDFSIPQVEFSGMVKKKKRRLILFRPVDCISVRRLRSYQVKNIPHHLFFPAILMDLMIIPSCGSSTAASSNEQL
jgi:hypothetical protein